MMCLMLPYHTGRRYVIDVVGNLTTLAICDTSVMSAFINAAYTYGILERKMGVEAISD